MALLGATTSDNFAVALLILLFVGDHALLNLGQDGQQFLGCSLDVGHGLLELVDGAEAAQAVHGHATDSALVYLTVRVVVLAADACLATAQ